MQTTLPQTDHRKFIAPEVVQSSMMDCGPASLKCLLEGFGISASYGRLREACQTDVDGSSIDTLEEVAVQLGLDAEQIMIPVDHVLLSEAKALPAIIVVKLPNGNTHFVILWRKHGRFMQVMDPAVGRRLTRSEKFLDELFIHTMAVSAGDWRDWAGTDEFLNPLRQRLKLLGFDSPFAEQIIATAQADSTWKSLSVLDASIRLVQALVRAEGLKRGPETVNCVKAFFAHALASEPAAVNLIPKHFWSAYPEPADPNSVLLRGAVLVRVKGHRAPDIASEIPTLSPELVAALTEAPSRPLAELIRLVLADGPLMPSILLCSIIFAGALRVFQALLLRGLLDVGDTLVLPAQRIGAIVALLVFVGALTLFDFSLIAGTVRMGRRLETRLRVAFLSKIPRLGDQYFRSRLNADMAERAHVTHEVTNLPYMVGQFIQIAAEVCFTVVGLIWLDVSIAPLAILSGVLTIGLPIVTQPFLTERNLRAMTHVGALSRFSMDSLLGMIPIRTHGAGKAMRHEYEALLGKWVKARLDFQQVLMAVVGIQSVSITALAVLIGISHLARGGSPVTALLLIYWAVNLTTLGEQLLEIARQYPIYRNITLRLLEPLGAREETTINRVDEIPESEDVVGRGVAVQMSEVKVVTAGHTILENISFSLRAGEHIAIVGPSGAGKSTLIGLLLGWNQLASGTVQVDGQLLQGQHLQQLRRATAWVDPAVQLWNRSILDNIYYGAGGDLSMPFASVVQSADLQMVLNKLGGDTQTRLGESGALVAGGEGQRVRLARAMARPGIKLVILDEPFRGLDRQQRHELLVRARELWHEATLICITHDIEETQSFHRVLVIEAGHLVEDDSPATLMNQPQSRYCALIAKEQSVRSIVWGSPIWRQIQIDGGKLVEQKRTKNV